MTKSFKIKGIQSLNNTFLQNLNMAKKHFELSV